MHYRADTTESRFAPPSITSQYPKHGTPGGSTSPVMGETTEWEMFLEDLSANGTYVNGRRLIKNTTTAIRSDDEISFCNRFTSQEKPTVPWFLGPWRFG